MKVKTYLLIEKVIKAFTVLGWFGALIALTIKLVACLFGICII